MNQDDQDLIVVPAERSELEDQGQQVFAHMIRQLTHNFRPELVFD
jgi:hypothetical protein